MKRAIAAVIAVAVWLILFAAPASAETSALTCRLTKTAKKHDSAIFRSTLIRVRLTVSWCHNGKKVSRVNVGCQILENDPVTVDPGECQTQKGSFGWGGRPDGGAWALASVGYKNCAPPILNLCQNRTINVELWLYADGTATKSQR